MSIWFNTHNSRNDLDELYSQARARRQTARLDLIAAEAAIVVIENELATDDLQTNGIYWREFSTPLNVLVEFSDGPTPCILESVKEGKVFLRHIGKNKKPLKKLYSYKWTIAKHVKPRP